MSSQVQVRETQSHGAFLVASAEPGSDPAVQAAHLYAQLADLMAAHDLRVVQERLFASLSALPVIDSARREALEHRGIPSDGPRTCLQGRPAWGAGLAGVLVRALPARQVSTIADGEVPCGYSWQTGGATFTLLQQVQGEPCKGGQPGAQADRAIEQAERVLRANGASYRDTVRTWFYLSNILGWYSQFNQVRSAAYARFGLMPSASSDSATPEAEWRLPASTGILADSREGAACSMDLLAVTSEDRGIVELIRNPAQKEAYRYGSAFSRCAVVHLPGEDLVEVSGTAAIDEQGHSMYRGDICGQVRCTVDKIGCLLERARASFTDICAATVFIKRAEHYSAARETMAACGLAGLPAVWVQADVCRDDLLFEIDAEAVVRR